MDITEATRRANACRSKAYTDNGQRSRLYHQAADFWMRATTCAYAETLARWYEEQARGVPVLEPSWDLDGEIVKAEAI